MNKFKPKRNFKLGLTGSIGMGKTTVSNIFKKNDIPVWSADTVVHELYEPNAAGTSVLKDLLPEVISENGVCREKLSGLIVKKPNLIKIIETKVFPLVKLNRDSFIKQHEKKSLLLFDIPLLYETNANLWLDSVLVVTAPKEIQKKRVMDRDGMTKGKFEFFLSNQIPDKVKCERADYVINTHVTLSMLEKTVKQLIQYLI